MSSYVLDVWIITFIFLTAASTLHTEAAPDCHLQSVNSTISLQEAIIKSVSNVDNSTICVRIELSSGEHAITSQTLFPAHIREIEFVGIGKSISLSCYYDLRWDYTWYFSGQSSVTFRNIHFQNCPRPLRIDTVANVRIKDCTFR